MWQQTRSKLIIAANNRCEFDSPEHDMGDTVSARIGVKIMEALVAVLSFVVFALLDVLDFTLCTVYRLADYLMEKDWSPCYCSYPFISSVNSEKLSETLYYRKNFVRELVYWMKKLTKYLGRRKCGRESLQTVSSVRQVQGVRVARKVGRWSDCCCQRCASWNSSDKGKLYFFLGGQGSSTCASSGDLIDSESNVILIHGFLSSSSLWIETIYPSLSEATKLAYRFFAVDLLGFGKSPKPSNCSYTVTQHVDMIEQSVLLPYKVNSFHLVAHSMGCIIALALAAKHPNMLRSITLLSPPYFPAPAGEQASQFTLKNIAPKKIWPFLTFGASIMSWYEHVGRTVCLIVCKNHQIWEWILKQLRCNRKPNFLVEDLTRHTHYSAWHNFHNVICGAAGEMDKYLEIVKESKCKVMIMHGKQDGVLPATCSLAIKRKICQAKLTLVENANHSNIILGREGAVAKELEEFWASC